MGSSLYEDIRAEICRRGWVHLCSGEFMGLANYSMMLEFYANVSFSNEEEHIFVRNMWIPFGIKELDAMFNLYCVPEIVDDYWQMVTTRRFNFVKVAENLSMEGA